MHIDSQSFYDYTNYETNSVQGPIPVSKEEEMLNTLPLTEPEMPEYEPRTPEYIEAKVRLLQLRKGVENIKSSSDPSETKIERYKEILDELDTLRNKGSLPNSFLGEIAETRSLVERLIQELEGTGGSSAQSVPLPKPFGMR